MKPATRHTVGTTLQLEAEVIQLPAAEYSSLDAAKLDAVRRLLLKKADHQNSANLLVDLSTVQFFGATFVGILVSTWDRLRSNNRRLLLCGLTPLCARLVHNLSMDRLFDIYPTRRAALEKIRSECHGANGAVRSLAAD